MKKLLSKSAPLFIAILFVSTVAYASFGFQTRSYEELYNEEVETTNETGEQYNKQLIKELRARKDLAIFKGQAAFGENNSEEVDRLQKLISEIDGIILDLQSTTQPELTRRLIDQEVAVLTTGA